MRPEPTGRRDHAEPPCSGSTSSRLWADSTRFARVLEGSTHVVPRIVAALDILASFGLIPQKCAAKIGAEGLARLALLIGPLVWPGNVGGRMQECLECCGCDLLPVDANYCPGVMRLSAPAACPGPGDLRRTCVDLRPPPAGSTADRAWGIERPRKKSGALAPSARDSP